MSKKDVWKDRVKILKDYDSPAIHNAEPMYADPTTDSIPEAIRCAGLTGAFGFSRRPLRGIPHWACTSGVPTGFDLKRRLLFGCLIMEAIHIVLVALIQTKPLQG